MLRSRRYSAGGSQVSTAHNLSGMTFCRLQVLRRDGSLYGKPAWLCACECGVQVTVGAANLKNGSTKSCGCYSTELLVARVRTHGMSDTPEYNSWHAMMERCYNRSHPYYDNYGGRGIVVCAEWQEFSSFLRDMGPRPEGTTIERSNGQLGYAPGNCVWATRKVQAASRRKRKCKLHKVGRILMTRGQMAAMTGLSPQTIGARLRMGWGTTKAMTTPLQRGAKC